MRKLAVQVKLLYMIAKLDPEFVIFAFGILDKHIQYLLKCLKVLTRPLIRPNISGLGQLQINVLLLNGP